ncbi:MAG: hypothetical protein EOO01_14190, partial [Chitinophagaceae bacterium]
MNETPTPTNPIPPATTSHKAGMFGTKIPSAVAYGVGILLFFLPFLDIKCNSMILQKVSGVQLATGFRIESPGSDNSLIGSLEKLDDKSSRMEEKMEKKEANLIALASLILGIAALICTLAARKTAGIISGLLAAVGLVATMVDVKGKLKAELPDLQSKTDALKKTDFEKFGNDILI